MFTFHFVVSAVSTLLIMSKHLIASSSTFPSCDLMPLDADVSSIRLEKRVHHCECAFRDVNSVA